MSIHNLCLISASVLVLTNAANATGPKIDLDPNFNNSTHTQHTLELKPISQLEAAFQTTRVLFLPDVADDKNAFGNSANLDNDYNRGDCNKNEALFSTKNCKSPKVLGDKCTMMDTFYRSCTCPSQYQYTSQNCSYPKALKGAICDNKYASCSCLPSVTLNNSNEVCTQYCGGNCIEKTCKPTPNDKNCQYGVTSVSNGCGGTRDVCKSCTILPNETGCSYGTYSCSDGCGGTTRTCCLACSRPTCSGISSKPTNSSYTTASCTDCSGAKTINTGWSCNSGYKKDGSSCILDTMSCNDLSTLISNTSENTQINMISDVQCIDNPLTLKKGQKLYGNGYTLKISLIDNPYGITMNKDSSIENIKFEMQTAKGKVYYRNMLYIPVDSGNNTLKDITLNLNDVQTNGGHYFAYFRAGTLNLVGNLTFNAACNSAGNYGSIFTTSFQGGPSDTSEVTVLMRDVRINANICQLDLFSGDNMVTEVLGNSQITATILRNGSISPVYGFDVTRLNFTDNSIITLYTSDVGLSLSDAKQSYISNYAKVNIKAKNESGLNLFDGWGAKLAVQGNAVLELCSAKTTFDTNKITKSGAGKATSRVDASCGNGL